MSESALRAYAEAYVNPFIGQEEGYAVTHTQFQDYVRAGALGEPVGTETRGGKEYPRWPAEAGERLVLVRKLGSLKTNGGRPPSLPRRVILLRNHDTFPVAPEKLRQAMLDLIPLIGAPVTKMRRVDEACRYWGAFEAAAGPPPKGITLPHGWKPPHRDQWREILQSEDADYFDTRAGMQYYAAQAILPLYVTGTRYNLDDILEEELVTLLTIRDLAAWRRLREESARENQWRADIQAEIEREDRYYQELGRKTP